MSSFLPFKERITEVLTRYNCKPLPLAAIDALAVAMDRMVENRTPSCTEPHLGLATNEQLLNELRVRIEIFFPGGLDYMTVGGEEIAKRGPTVRPGKPLGIRIEDTPLA